MSETLSEWINQNIICQKKVITLYKVTCIDDDLLESEEAFEEIDATFEHYKCRVCNSFFNNDDDVITHAQEHLNNIKNAL